MEPIRNKWGHDSSQFRPIFDNRSQKRRRFNLGYVKKIDILYIHDNMRCLSWNDYSKGIIATVKGHLSNSRTLSIYIQINTTSFEKKIEFLFQLYKMLKKYDPNEYKLHMTWIVYSQNEQVLQTRLELNRLFKLYTDLWMLTEDFGGVAHL